MQNIIVHSSCFKTNLNVTFCHQTASLLSITLIDYRNKSKSGNVEIKAKGLIYKYRPFFYFTLLCSWAFTYFYQDHYCQR